MTSGTVLSLFSVLRSSDKAHFTYRAQFPSPSPDRVVTYKIFLGKSICSTSTSYPLNNAEALYGRVVTDTLHKCFKNYTGGQLQGSIAAVTVAYNYILVTDVTGSIKSNISFSGNRFVPLTKAALRKPSTTWTFTAFTVSQHISSSVIKFAPGFVPALCFPFSRKLKKNRMASRMYSEFFPLVNFFLI